MKNLLITAILIGVFSPAAEIRNANSKNINEINQRIKLLIKEEKTEALLDESVKAIIELCGIKFQEMATLDVLNFANPLRRYLREAGVTADFLVMLEKACPKEDPESLYVHASAQEYFGQKSKAIELYEKIHSAEPDAEPVILKLLSLYLTEESEIEKLPYILNNLPENRSMDFNYNVSSLFKQSPYPLSRRSAEERIDIADHFREAAEKTLSPLCKAYLYSIALRILEEPHRWNNDQSACFITVKPESLRAESERNLLLRHREAYKAAALEMMDTVPPFSCEGFSCLVNMERQSVPLPSSRIDRACELLKTQKQVLTDRNNYFLYNLQLREVTYLKTPSAFAVEFYSRQNRLDQLKKLLSGLHPAVADELKLRLLLVEADNEEFPKKVEALLAQKTLSFSDTDSICSAFHLRESYPDLSEVYQKSLTSSSDVPDMSKVMKIGRIISCDKKFLRNPERLVNLIEALFKAFFTKDQRILLKTASKYELASKLDAGENETLTLIGNLILRIDSDLNSSIYAMDAVNKSCPSLLDIAAGNIQRVIWRTPIKELIKIEALVGDFDSFIPLVETRYSGVYIAFLRKLSKNREESLKILEELTGKRFGSFLTKELLRSSGGECPGVLMNTAGEYKQAVKTAEAHSIKEFYKLYQQLQVQTGEQQADILTAKGKELLDFLSTFNWKNRDNAADNFLKTEAPEGKYNVYKYLDKGADIYALIQNDHPGKAKTILKKLVADAKDVESKEVSASLQKRLWHLIDLKTRNDELMLAMISNLPIDLPHITDFMMLRFLRWKNHYDNIIDWKETSFLKDLPEFYTASGYKNSVFITMVSIFNDKPELINELWHDFEKTFGGSLFLDVCNEYNNLNTNTVLNILGKRFDEIKALPESHRMDFYRFFEIASRGFVTPDDSQLTPQGQAFYSMYLSERNDQLRRQLSLNDVNAKVNALKLLFEIGDREEVKKEITLLFKQHYRKHESSVLDYIPVTVHDFQNAGQPITMEFMHFIVLKSIEFNQSVSSSFNKKIPVDAKGTLLTYPQYLINNPQAFLETPLSRNTGSFDAVPFNKTFPTRSLLENIFNQIQEPSNEKSVGNFCQKLQKEPSAFGTELFAVLAGKDPSAIKHFLEQNQHRIQSLKEPSRSVCISLFLSNFGETASLETLEEASKVTLANQVEVFMGKDISENEWENMSRAADLVTRLITEYPEKAEENLIKISNLFEMAYPDSKESALEKMIGIILARSPSPQIYFACMKIAEKHGSKIFFNMLCTADSSFLFSQKKLDLRELISSPFFGDRETFRLYVGTLPETTPIILAFYSGIESNRDEFLSGLDQLTTEHNLQTFGISFIRNLIKTEKDELIAGILLFCENHINEIKQLNPSGRKELFRLVSFFKTYRKDEFKRLQASAPEFLRYYTRRIEIDREKDFTNLLEHPELIQNLEYELKALSVQINELSDRSPEKAVECIMQLAELLQNSPSTKSEKSILTQLDSIWQTDRFSPLAYCILRAAEKMNDSAYLRKHRHSYRVYVYEVYRKMEDEVSALEGNKKQKQIETAYRTFKYLFEENDLQQGNLYREGMIYKIKSMSSRQLDELLDRLTELKVDTPFFVEFLVLVEALSYYRNRDYSLCREIILTFYSDFLPNTPISDYETTEIYKLLFLLFQDLNIKTHLAPFAARAFVQLHETIDFHANEWRNVAVGLRNRECNVSNELLTEFSSAIETCLKNSRRLKSDFSNPRYFLNLLALIAKAGHRDDVEAWIQNNRFNSLTNPAVYMVLAPYDYHQWITDDFPKRIKELNPDNLDFKLYDFERLAANSINFPDDADSAFTFKLLTLLHPPCKKGNQAYWELRRTEIDAIGINAVKRDFNNPDMKFFVFRALAPKMDYALIRPLIEKFMSGETLEHILANNDHAVTNTAFASYLKCLLTNNDIETFTKAVTINGKVNEEDWKRWIGPILSRFEYFPAAEDCSHIPPDRLLTAVNKLMDLFRFFPSHYNRSGDSKDHLFSNWYILNAINGIPFEDTLETFAMIPKRYKKDARINFRTARMLFCRHLDSSAGEQELKDAFEFFLNIVYLSDYSRKFKSHKNALFDLANTKPFRKSRDKWLVIGAEFLAEHNVKKELKRYKKRFNKIKDDDLKARALKTLE